MGAAPILTISKNGETIRSLPVETEADLGRAEGCVIRLDDRAISRQHAVFKRKGQSLQVERKSEFAPLMVNGQDCTRAILKEGDVISIGPYLVKVKSESSSESQPPQLDPPDAASPSAREAAPAGAVAIPPVVLEQASGEISQAMFSAAESVALEAPALPLEPMPELPQAAASESPENAAASDPAQPESEVPNLSLASDEKPADSESPASPIQPLQSETAPLDMAQMAEPLNTDAPQSGDMDFTQVLGDRSAEMKLVFPPGAANYTEFSLKEKEISIGRGSDCDIVLNDKKCSRKNSLITKNALDVRIKDLNSVNGTYVNGQKISTEHELSAGDKIRIGDVDFVFNADQKGYAQKDYLPVESMPEATSTFALSSANPGDLGSPMVSMPTESADGLSAAQAAPIPGVAETNTQGIAGIAGIGDEMKRQKGLMEKFRALPKGRQYLWIVIIVSLLYFGLFDEDAAPLKKKAKPKTAQTQVKDADKDASGNKKTSKAFDALTKDQQNFVRTQHRLAFEYYQSKDYDNALFEVEKIFKYVDDFEDSREIEQYAREGKRRLELLLEEKRKKEDEEARIKKLQGLIASARGKMDAQKYSEVQDLFAQILTMDPENAQVATWQAKIKEHEEDLRIAAQKKRVQEEVNQEAWKVLNSGIALRKLGQYHEAIETLRKVKEVGASDPGPKARASAEIKGIHEEIKSKLEPMIQAGKDKENAGDFQAAIDAYKKVLDFENENPTATQGIDRIKTILNDRAKALYTEAVLAESYSDFATAKKKFRDCLDAAPTDSAYHDKAERKLSRYFKQPGVVDDSIPPSLNQGVTEPSIDTNTGTATK